MIDADDLIEEADKLGRRFVDLLNESPPPIPVQLVAVFTLLVSILASIKCKQARENISRETVAMLFDVLQAAREQPVDAGHLH